MEAIAVFKVGGTVDSRCGDPAILAGDGDGDLAGGASRWGISSASRTWCGRSSADVREVRVR